METDRITVAGVDGIPMLVFHGDFSDALEEMLLTAYGQMNHAHLLMQFADSKHIYSSGVALLVELISRAQAKGQQLHAVGLSSHFHRVFRITALTEYMTVHASLEQAISHIQQPDQE